MKRNTWHTDTDRIIITCIEHIHQISRNSGTWFYYGIILRELSAYFFTIAIKGLHITFQRIVARSSTYGFV